MINVGSKKKDRPGAAALSNPRVPVTETLLLLPSPSPEGRGPRGQGRGTEGSAPSSPHPPHTGIAHRPGHPEAVFEPGQEDRVPRLCSSAPRANRGSARKGSRSHAFGSHWINAAAVLEGSSGRALQSPGTGLDRRAPARTPCRSASTSVGVCVMRACCSYSTHRDRTEPANACEASAEGVQGWVSLRLPPPRTPQVHPASLVPRHRGSC